jgi:hypothetical protein
MCSQKVALVVLFFAVNIIFADCQVLPQNRFVPCPPTNVSLLEGAEEFFNVKSFVLEHLTMTYPASLSPDPVAQAKSRANYEQLLRTRECAWFSVPLSYLNDGVTNVQDSACSGPYCYINITLYRFPWESRRTFLTQPANFNPPNVSNYPFDNLSARRRPLEGQMMLIEDGPGRDATDMQSMLIDQFGLVYEPLDFYLPNMRGCASTMDNNRNVSVNVPSQTTVSCSSSVSLFDFTPDHLQPCIQEANLKYGRWMSGITTRQYANDLLFVLDSNPLPAPATRRLVYGRGYGATVADEMQTILNCNSRRLRKSLSCPWWSGGGAGSSCGNNYFIVRPDFQLHAFVFDGGHDFERSDTKQLFQGVNLVGHLALQSCPSSTCRQLFGKEGYQAALDAFYLMNQGWCPQAIEAGFSQDRLVTIASLFSIYGFNPKFSVMASGSLPALNAVVFRYMRCLPEDVQFLSSVSRANLVFEGEVNPPRPCCISLNSKP